MRKIGGVIAVAAIALTSCSGDTQEAAQVAHRDPTPPRELVDVTVAEPFVIESLDGLLAEVTIEQIHHGLDCGDEYTPEGRAEQFIGVEFDVRLLEESEPSSFFHPGWFRVQEQDGYVTDDVTFSTNCDPPYNEFTDRPLQPGDRHRGWVLLNETVPRDSILEISAPVSLAEPLVNDVYRVDLAQGDVPDVAPVEASPIQAPPAPPAPPEPPAVEPVPVEPVPQPQFAPDPLGMTPEIAEREARQVECVLDGGTVEECESQIFGN